MLNDEFPESNEVNFKDSELVLGRDKLTNDSADDQEQLSKQDARFQQLEAKNRELERKIDEQQSFNVRVIKKFEAIEKMLEDPNALEINALKFVLLKKEKELQDATKVITVKEAELKSKDAELVDLAKQLYELNAELRRVKEENKMISRLEQETQKLKEELKEARMEVNSVNRQMANLKQAPYPRPPSTERKNGNANKKKVKAPRVSCRKRARSPPSEAAKRVPPRDQSPPEEETSNDVETEKEPQPTVPSLVPRAKSTVMNPAASGGEEKRTDDIFPLVGEKSEAKSSQKKEEEDMIDTSSGADADGISSKKVSPVYLCSSSQNAQVSESRSPSTETERTTSTPELNSTMSSCHGESPDPMEQEEEAPAVSIAEVISGTETEKPSATTPSTPMRRCEYPDALKPEEEVAMPPATHRPTRRVIAKSNPALSTKSSSSSRAESEEHEVETSTASQIALRAQNNKENVASTTTELLNSTSCRAENSEAMEQEEQATQVEMSPSALHATDRLEQSKDVPSTSTQNAKRAEDTSGAEKPSATTPSTSLRYRESSEAIEKKEAVAMPPPVISSPPPTRRETRNFAKLNPVEPVPRAVSKESVSSKKRIKDVPSTSSQSEPPQLASIKNALRAQQQLDKENVPTTSSAVTGNPSKFACCTMDATSLPYHAGNLRCVNHPDCRITPDAEFWELEGSVTETFYCLRCFEEKKPEGKFEKKTNDNDEVEPILECKKCRRSFHLCCSFYYEEDLSEFVCEECSGVRTKKTITGVENCSLGAFMTKRMMDFLASRLDVVEYPIRICGFSEAKSAKTSTVVPPVMRNHFVKKLSKTMNYVSRALHVYQRVDDVDVITFAIYTAEYEYHGENEKWCIIDYIDSLPYFKRFEGVQKKEIHNLLIHTYYEYMGGLGYRQSHLWSNPSQKGDDYVFNIHPFDQPFLNPTGLIAWYHKLLEDGENKKILAGFKNFKEARFAKPVDIPVFVGSLWSIVFKETTQPTTMKKFMSELEEKKEKHGEDNFFIEIAAPKTRQPPQTTHNTHEILGDRVKLLELCIDKNWQFEDIRRAKYSSVALIRMMDE